MLEIMKTNVCVCPGVGGNLVAIQASRLSTYLHWQSVPGELPDQAAKGCPSLGSLLGCSGQD